MLVILVSCNARKGPAEKYISEKPLDSLEIKYAKGFSVDNFRKFKRVTVYNPWKKGEILARYYLTGDSSVKTPSDGIRIITPVSSVAATSCTQYAFIDILGEMSSLKGICDYKRVYNENIRNAFSQGLVKDLGDPYSINMESCIMLKPDILLVSGYNQYDEHVARLSSAGLSVVFDNEWMESTLLGRAEWIKFIACFYNKSAQADSVFEIVEKRYDELVKIAGKAESVKPVVLSGDNFRGTWYQPGGRSFTAQLFKDAGGNYIYRNDTTSGSVPYSFEQVYHDLKDADIWVGANSGKSLNAMLSADRRYSDFRPFRIGNVYSYDNRVTPEGGNDYWETAVARPDWLLEDMISLFHPELLPNHKLFYLKKLK